MVKYIFKSINLLIFSLTILFYSDLYSYENLNECKLTKELIYKFKDKLSLDERFFEKVEGFGIDLDAFDDKYYLSKIHPDIIQKTGNKNLSVRSEVKEINGINLSELNKRSIEQNSGHFS